MYCIRIQNVKTLIKPDTHNKEYSDIIKHLSVKLIEKRKMSSDQTHRKTLSFSVRNFKMTGRFGLVNKHTRCET